MIYADKITSEDGIRELVAYRFPDLGNVSVDPHVPDRIGFCLECKCDSTGPLIWIQNRLMESGQYYTHGGRDDQLIDSVRIVGGKAFASIARSKFFSALPIKIVSPIDLNAFRVSYFPTTERPEDRWWI